MTRLAVLGSTLFVIWLLLSGYLQGLLLTLGALSCLMVVWIVHRMALLDIDDGSWSLRPGACFRYLFWLTGQVVQSNLAVAKIVLTNKGLQPAIRSLPASQKTLFGRAIYANSITLTPGTVSMNASQNQVEVHALSATMLDDLAGGAMDSRVSQLERPE